jgi:hypothetical protein
MLALYYNKSKCELKIQKNCKAMYNQNHIQEIEEKGIAYYNSNYYIAEDRKPLVEKAQELRLIWIAEAKTRLTELENMSYPKR